MPQGSCYPSACGSSAAMVELDAAEIKIRAARWIAGTWRRITASYRVARQKSGKDKSIVARNANASRN
jgi:hypothetical protein